MAAALYANDWEDPRLSVEGFITDYVVWRLAVEGIEWRDAQDVAEGAEAEHILMRKACAVIEYFIIERGIVVDSVAAYLKVVEPLAENAHVGSELLDVLPILGLACALMARENMWDEVQLITSATSTYIDARIRSSWGHAGFSWAAFVLLYTQSTAPYHRPERYLHLPPLPPHFTDHALMIGFTFGVVIGAVVAIKVLVKKH